MSGSCGLACNCGSEGNCLVHLRAVNHDLRERLATAEAEGTRWQRQSDDWQRRGWELGEGLDAALADAAALREQLGASHELLDKKDATIRNMEKGERAKLEMCTAIYQEMRTRAEVAEALALTNGAERDELRGLVERVADSERGPILDGALHACFNWLAAHPAIPEAEAKPKGTL